MLVKVKQNKTLLSWALLLVLALVWGSSFVLIKKGLLDGEPVFLQHLIGMAAILAGVYVANRL